MWGNNLSNTALSADPENGGAGFQPWTSQEEYSPGNEVNCGYYTAAPTYNFGANRFPGLSAIDDSCFIMYGHSNTGAYARRKMRMPLSDNGVIKVRVGVAFRNGRKGVRFIDNSTTPPISAFEFVVGSFEGNDHYIYKTPQNSYIALGWGYNDTSTFEISLYNRPFLTFPAYMEIIRLNNGSPPPQYIPLNNPIQIDELEFFVQNTDDSSEQNNLYFNILSGYSAYR